MTPSKIRIVGLGMACLDILIQGQQLPTWQHGVRFEALAVEGGGPVATALVAAQRLGVSAGFIGTYGNDRLGAIKIQTLSETGVDISQVVQRSNPENQVVLVSVHSTSGERIFSGVHVDSPPLDTSEIEQEYITQADILHLDGYHYHAALRAANWMKQAKKPVMLDGSATNGPISPDMRALVEMADYLICGTGFGPALTGERDIWKAGHAMLDMGPKVVVQTEGKQGSYTVTANESFHTPIFEVDVVDTTGAGDVFHGAYMVGLLQGWDLSSISLFCSAVSAIKCTQLSGRRGIPTMDQTLDFLSARGVKLP